MATKKTEAGNEAVEIIEEVKEKKAPKAEKKDPWSEKVAVQIPKTADGSANYIIASCNGRVYKVMKGVKVDVPAPIAEVLEHMFEAEEAAELYIAAHAN